MSTNEADMGKPPVHYYGKNGQWRDGKRYISVNYGTVEAPDYQWAEVLYSWVGQRGKWYLQYDVNTYVGDATLENARYFEGPPFRGDMAFFGNGLQELPDPILNDGENASWFLGSQYKFHTSPTDTTQNYSNFTQWVRDPNNPLQDIIGPNFSGVSDPEYYSPFEIDGVLQTAKFRGEHYFDTVWTPDDPAYEGFNWGLGAIWGTIPNIPNPNIMAIAFRMPAGGVAQGQWLWYGGAKAADQDNGTDDCWAGVWLRPDGSVWYIRYKNGTVVRVEIPAGSGGEWVAGEWNVCFTWHDAADFGITMHPNEPNEVSASGTMPNGSLVGPQFKGFYIGAGPIFTEGTNSVNDIDSKEVRSTYDLFRMYIETTTGTFDSNLAPEWWKVFKFAVYANLGTADGTEIDVTNRAISLTRTQGNRVFYMQNPPEVLTEPYSSDWWISFETNSGRSNKLPIRIVDAPIRTRPLFCDFNDQEVWEQEFLIAHKQWGGTGQTGSDVVLLNGGVVSENIEVYPSYRVNDSSEGSDQNSDGILRCWANGSFYTGDIVGVDRAGNTAADGRKTEVGACLASRDYLGAGRFRMKIRATNRIGCCNCCWTFHYEEIYENDERWQDFLDYGDTGLRPQGSEDDGFYIVRNNEIDIEFPTALKTNPNVEDVDMKQSRLNSWQGEQRNWDLEDTPEDPEYWTEFIDVFQQVSDEALNDGKWHEIGFDWHVDDPNPPVGKAAKRVDYYVDDILVLTIEDYVPDIPGRFWMGTWFPRAPGNRWSGPHANYERDSMDIDWFSWTPFEDEFHAHLPSWETYPNDVWRSWTPSNVKADVTSTNIESSLQLPQIVLDDLPKKSDGDWENVVWSAAGTNPPEFMGQNAVELRTDKRGLSGQRGDFLVNATALANVRVKVTCKSMLDEGNGAILLAFGVADRFVLPTEVGESIEVEFSIRPQGNFVITWAQGGLNPTLHGAYFIELTYI